MSNLLHQYVVNCIWEEKKKHPEAFEMVVQSKEEVVAAEAPRITSSTSTRPKPSRHDRIQEALQAAMGSDGKKLSQRDRETIRKVLEQEGSDE